MGTRIKSDMKAYFEDINCESIVGSKTDDIKMISEYIKKRISPKKDMNILILGCGNGIKEEYIFKNADNFNLLFIDMSQTMINSVKTRFPNAEAIRMDITGVSTHTITTKFDIIYSFAVVQYFTSSQLRKINENLFDLLAFNGKIVHLNIPDKSRRYLYRLNNVLIHKKLKYFGKCFDFIDEYSNWISKKCFYGIKHSKVTIITPSYNWERYDAIIQKKR